MWWCTKGFIFTLYFLGYPRTSLFQWIWNFQWFQFLLDFYGFLIFSSLFCAYLLNLSLLIEEGLALILLMNNFPPISFNSSFFPFLYLSGFCPGMITGIFLNNSLISQKIFCFDEDNLSWIFVVNCQCSLLWAQVVLKHILLSGGNYLPLPLLAWSFSVEYWQYTVLSIEHEFCMTRLDLVQD